MSNAINNPTWEVISSVNYQLQQEQQTQKRGQARIAEANHLQGKQQVAKDVILPSASDGQEANAKAKKGVEAKPKLPVPKAKFAGLKGEDGKGGDDSGKTLGLIAIIGEVMALQAKSNSNFWSTLWKQASQSMMMEVKFAPIIANAIKSAYTAQSLATQAQADQSKEDGIINLCMFGGAMLMAGVMEFTGDSPEAGATQDDALTEDETTNAEADAPEETGQSIQQDTEADEAQANQEINNEDSSWKNRLKRTGKFIKDVAGKSQQRLTGLLGKGMQAAMMMDLASKGITGYFVDSKYQAKQAYEQGQEGQSQAVSKEAEQYAQFYGQSFSRSEDLRQGGQQNIDYAMNILKSAADTITQTVTSMFRG